MYFNNIPNNFGQAQIQNPSGFMNKPIMGYNQGIGGIQQNPANPSFPAPQLGNVSGIQQGMPQKNMNPPNAPVTQYGPGRSVQQTTTPFQAQQPQGMQQQVMPQQISSQQIQNPQFQPMPVMQQKPQVQNPISRPTRFAGQAMAEGGVVRQNLAKGGVVAEGIAALRGKHPSPRDALDKYDRTFGRDATAELIRAYADGGVVSGPGSGVADLVPGSIDGREDVRIASGEYVIPAWAVAALGDGSTEAGAKILDAMVARLREAGSELIKGSEPINPSEFLPG
jgi:hypothetical protein